MNKLNALPRGFGAFPALEVLDLTYNNLSEKSLPGNFFCLGMNKMTINIQFLGNYLYIIVHFTKYIEQVASFVLPRAFIIVFSFIFFEFMYSLHYSKNERKTWYNMLISGLFMYKNFKNIL